MDVTPSLVKAETARPILLCTTGAGLVEATLKPKKMTQVAANQFLFMLCPTCRLDPIQSCVRGLGSLWPTVARSVTTDVLLWSPQQVKIPRKVKETDLCGYQFMLVLVLDPDPNF